MSDLLKKEREFVMPGDEIVRSMDFLPGKNCFREGESIYAKKIGIVSVSSRVLSVIPLNSVYIPKAGDMVIGKVEEIQSNGWLININSPYIAYLPLSGVREFIDTNKTSLSKFYDIDDIIYTKIASSTYGSVHVSMQDSRCMKFTSGRLVSMNPARVPRLIGKDGSMIKVIKDSTQSRISVGQNGLVWLEGEKENLAIRAIKLIEEESQVDGLTDRVSELLKSAK